MPKKRIDDTFPLDKWYPYGSPIAPLGFTSGGGTPAVTTFPGEPLRTKAMIALNPDFTQSYLNWQWVDIVRDEEGDSLVRWEQQIDITYGGRANSAVGEASLCTCRATNDRRFSRRNPLSPYFNQLSEYTPLWVQLDYGQGFKDKYFGFIHDFAKAWDHRSAPYVDLTARGPLHRIGKSKPLKSPIHRAISGVAEDDFKAQSFWPAEDAAGSTQIASALPNQSPVIPTGPVTYGQIGPEGAQSVIEPGDGFSATFPVASYDDTGRWAITWIMKIDAEIAATTKTLLTVHTDGGDLPTWRLVLDNTFPNFELRWNAYNAADVLTYDVFFFPTDVEGAFFGQWFMLTFGVYHPSAFPGNAQSTMAVDNGSDERFHATNGGLFAGQVGPIKDFTFDVDSVLSSVGIQLGEFGVFVDPNFRPFNQAAAQANGDALHGYDGELTIPRMRRIAREERIPFWSTGLDEDSAACGPQTAGSLINAFRQPEKVDGGRIYEHQFGIAYKSHHEFTNQAVTFTLDSALGQVQSLGVPVDNDLDFVNQWTIGRTNGSSATVAARKGEAGVTLTDNELLYEGSDTVSAYQDAQLEPIAARYGRHSTVDEDRWPAVSFHLAVHPELIDTWQLFPFGGRLQVLNVYEEVGLTTLDQIHRGHNERWNSRKWEVTLNCSPSTVYSIMELDSFLYGRVDSGSSTLQDDLSDSALTFLVDTADLTEIWTTDTAEFPLDIELFPGTGTAIASGGETIRIASVASVAKDTFTRSEVDQWGVMDTGQAWSLFTVGGAVSDFDVSAGVGTMIVDGANEYRVAILQDIAANRILNPEVVVTFTTGVPNVSGGSIEPGNLILRYVSTTDYYLCRVEVTTSEQVTISIHKNVNNVGTALSATVTTPIVYTAQALRVHFAVNGRTLRAKVYNPALPDTVDWQVTAEDDTFLNAGVVGIRTGVAAGNLDVPITVVYDNFEVYNPQLFTADERSLNGIVKAHKAGTVVRVADMVVIL